MESAPRQVYPTGGPETPPGCSTSPVAVAGEELPDATLPARRRRQRKNFIEVEALSLDPHELMFLANGFEDAARRKCAEETRA